MQIGNSLPSFTPASPTTPARPLSSDVSPDIARADQAPVAAAQEQQADSPASGREELIVGRLKGVVAPVSRVPGNCARNSWRSPSWCSVIVRYAPTNRLTPPSVGSTPAPLPMASSAAPMVSVMPSPAKSASIPLPFPMTPKRRCARWRSSCVLRSRPSNPPAGFASGRSGPGTSRTGAGRTGRAAA